ALHHEAVEADVARGLQPDLVEGGGEVVALVARAELAEGLGEGDGELASGAEAEDGVAQLLGAGEAGAGAADVGDEAGDAVVGAGALEGGDEGLDGGAAAAERAGDRVGRGVLDEGALEVDLEHGAGRDA